MSVGQVSHARRRADAVVGGQAADIKGADGMGAQRGFQGGADERAIHVFLDDEFAGAWLGIGKEVGAAGRRIVT